MVIVNKLKNPQNRKGFTLVELIVTMAILSIVLGAVMNLFLFNNKVYSQSENLASVQFDVRMAADFITTELRNMHGVSTENSALTNSVDLAKVKVKYPSVKNVKFKIIKQESKYLVLYSITGSDINNGNSYSLDSRVLLNNIKSATESTEMKPVIYYR